MQDSPLFFISRLGGTHMDDEKSLDELYELGTRETDEAADATADTIPDDDSDLLGQADADESASTPTNQFDIESLYPQFVERFQKEIVPQIQSQAVEEAMRRVKQGNKARDEQIKLQLAPLVDHLKRLEGQGLYTREDSARDEAEQREQQNVAAETRQRWLAQQQAPVPSEQRPIWQASTEARMNQILEQSGLLDTDAELQTVPLSITHPDPNEAVDYFRVKVESAVKAKQQRLQASAKPRPMIDMGTGGGAGQGNSLAGIEDTDQLWEMAQRA
jgi:hypothetical protein